MWIKTSWSGLFTRFKVRNFLIERNTERLPEFISAGRYPKRAGICKKTAWRKWVPSFFLSMISTLEYLSFATDHLPSFPIVLVKNSLTPRSKKTFFGNLISVVENLQFSERLEHTFEDQTNVHFGVRKAITEFSSCPRDEKNQNSKRAIVIITDGEFTEPKLAVEELQIAKSIGVEIFILAVGKEPILIRQKWRKFKVTSIWFFLVAKKKEQLTT